MNREIKFRGKRIDDNAWVYGSLLIDYAGTCQIWQKDESGAQHNFIVDPNTLGQYTGIKDKNGKEICEGDILKRPYNLTNVVVRWNIKGGSWEADCPLSDWSYPFNCFNIEEYEVIGTIYENPELLEE